MTKQILHIRRALPLGLVAVVSLLVFRELRLARAVIVLGLLGHRERARDRHLDKTIRVRLEELEIGDSPARTRGGKRAASFSRSISQSGWAYEPTRLVGRCMPAVLSAAAGDRAPRQLTW